MEFLAKLAGKRDGQVPPPQVVQLVELLANAGAERGRLEALLSSITGNHESSVPRVVSRLEDRAQGLTQLVEDASRRADRLQESSGAADVLEARIAALEASAARAEARADEAFQRADQFGQQCVALEELVARAQDTIEKLDAVVRDERVTRVIEQLPGLRENCEQALEDQAKIAQHLDELQSASAAAIERAETAGETSSRADEHAGIAAERLASLELKIDDLSRLQVLAFDATSELQNLNALAEHVNVKVKTLENQQQTVERALVDSRRVSEMVWEMDVQIRKLNEGSELVQTVGESIAKLEQLHEDITARLESASRDRSHLGEAFEQHQKKGTELLQTIQGQLDRLSVNRSEIDTLSERLAAAESGLANTERQLAALAASERALSELQGRLDGFASRAEVLSAGIARIEEQQPFLHALDGRLDELDGEIRRTTVRVEGLTRRRQELDALKVEFDACEATYAQVRARADELRDQKQQFSTFAEQARGFLRDTPEMEASIKALNDRVTEMGNQAERALGLRPQVEELGGRLELLMPRFPLMEQLQSRLSTLNELSGDIDHKLAAQVGRQADLEQSRILCEGLAVQIADAQQKLALVEAAQARLASVPEQLADVQAGLAEARQDVASIHQEQDVVVAHKRRLAEIHESAAALFSDIAERLGALHSVQAELERTGTLKDDLCRQLDQIHSIEREAFERHKEAESLLEQCTIRWKQVDRRRADLATLEQSMGAVEGRIQALDRLAGTLDAKIAVVAERDRIVDAVKHEVDAVHELARKCQDDLGAIADQRAAIGETRVDIDRLASALADANATLADVERRSAAVEDVRRKADAVVRLLDDVRVTLDTVGEQKAVVDHVTEMLAQFDDAISEARGTTKALQAERKLAQRIVESVRNIHARAGAEVG